MVLGILNDGPQKRFFNTHDFTGETTPGYCEYFIEKLLNPDDSNKDIIHYLNAINSNVDYYTYNLNKYVTDIFDYLSNIIKSTDTPDENQKNIVLFHLQYLQTGNFYKLFLDNKNIKLAINSSLFNPSHSSIIYIFLKNITKLLTDYNYLNKNPALININNNFIELYEIYESVFNNYNTEQIKYQTKHNTQYVKEYLTLIDQNIDYNIDIKKYLELLTIHLKDIINDIEFSKMESVKFLIYIFELLNNSSFFKLYLINYRVMQYALINNKDYTIISTIVLFLKTIINYTKNKIDTQNCVNICSHINHYIEELDFALNFYSTADQTQLDGGYSRRTRNKFRKLTRRTKVSNQTRRRKFARHTKIFNRMRRR
jgi:hypothetical protein